MSTTILTLGMHTVGRSEDATIVIEHPSCSRKHATLIVSPTHQVSLVDEGSSQGTFIDTVEVEPRKQTLLCDGARVQFGVSERSFLLQLPAVARYQAPARSGCRATRRRSSCGAASARLPTPVRGLPHPRAPLEGSAAPNSWRSRAPARRPSGSAMTRRTVAAAAAAAAAGRASRMRRHAPRGSKRSYLPLSSGSSTRREAEGQPF